MSVDQWTIDDKLALKALLLSNLKKKHDELTKSAQAAHRGATHEDAQAKSKYDTHGLELSYLAGSQYERAALLKSDIVKIEALAVAVFDDRSEIQLGSLVALSPKNKNGDVYYFLSSQGAGEVLEYKGLKITVLSPSSPMGEELLDGVKGDEVIINGRHFIISEIC